MKESIFRLSSLKFISILLASPRKTHINSSKVATAPQQIPKRKLVMNWGIGPYISSTDGVHQPDFAYPAVFARVQI